MATINSIACFLPLSTPKPEPAFPYFKSLQPNDSQQISSPRTKLKDNRTSVLVRSLSNELDVIPIHSDDSTDQQDGVVNGLERENEGEDVLNQEVGGFGNNEGRLMPFEGAAGVSSVGSSGTEEEEDLDKLIDRAINAAIVLAAGSFAITKLLTVDQDYWHGWTLFEILRYAPQHNWIVYEEALKSNTVLAKMMASGVVYSLGDWIARCYEGKPLFEFDRMRMFRSGLVGFTLHRSFFLFKFGGWFRPK